jgi:hypothetical protein
MKTNNHLRMSVMFSCSAVLSFALLVSAVAYSTSYYTVPWVACQGVGSDPSQGAAGCQLAQGTLMPMSALSGVYFDWYGVSGTTYYLFIKKLSFTGSYYSDEVIVSPTSTQSIDQQVVANTVLTNASGYDYLEANIVSSSGTLSLYGVAEYNSL